MSANELRQAAQRLLSEEWPSGEMWLPLAEWLDEESERRYHHPTHPALEIARIINRGSRGGVA